MLDPDLAMGSEFRNNNEVDNRKEMSPKLFGASEADGHGLDKAGDFEKKKARRSN
jgi:hypothetical protein